LFFFNIGATGIVVHWTVQVPYSRYSYAGPLLALPSGTWTPISISFNGTGLNPGTYSDTLYVVDTDDPTDFAAVPITIVVQAPPAPVLNVNPGSLSFTTTAGVNPAPALLSVANLGPAASTLEWNVQLPNNRYSYSGSTAPLPGGYRSDLNISFDVSGLAVGTYTDYITITSTDQRVNPVTVPVNITIKSSQNAYLGRFYGTVADNPDVDGENHSPFSDSSFGQNNYFSGGGNARATFQGNTLVLEVHASMSVSTSNHEDFSLNFTVNLPTSGAFGFRVNSWPDSYGHLEAQGTITSSNITGTWKYVRDDPSQDSSDSGSGWLSLNW
jgi:hypothetical protein